MKRTETRMNKPFRFGCALAVFALTLFCVPGTTLAGRGDKSGTAGASELLIPIGARGVALGGASLADVSGVEALYWNPAGLARGSRTTSVMFSHSTYLADIGVQYFGLTTGIAGDAALGFSIKSLSIGEIPVTTEDMPDGTGEMTTPTFLMAGGTFSRRVSDKISVGISATYVYEKMDRVSASAIAFTGGVQYLGLGGIDGLGVGVAVKNLGPKLKYDGAGLERTADVADALRPGAIVKVEAAASDLPSTIEIGLSYKTALDQVGDVVVESSFINNNYSDDEYRFGAEYLFDSKFSIRGGYSFAAVSERLEYIYGFSWGAGFKTEFNNIDLTLNYAYRAVNYFSGNHLIDVLLSF